MDNFYCAYPELKNKSLKWATHDSLKLFNYHKSNKKTAKLLKSLGWHENSIEYKFNSNGFRSEEFDSEGNSIVFLGCSHILGTGLDLPSTAAHIVSKQLGYKCFNLGLNGGCSDTCFRFAYYWLPKLKPKITVLMQPQKERFELFHFDKLIQMLGNDMPKPYTSFYKSWLSVDLNSELNYQKNLLAIKNICDTNNIKFVHVNNIFANNKIATARDLAHAGREPNKLKAQEILNIINKKY